MKLALAALVFFSLSLPAQIDQSVLAGSVTDQQSARVPNALVRVVQLSTGLERNTRSGPQGIYVIDGLPSGAYSVLFSAPGFGELRFARVEQVAGQTRTLDARLLVTASGQVTNVDEPLAQLDKSGAALGAALERAQLQELPLNGRNWSHLTAFAPGAMDTGPSDQRSIRFAGHGLDDNNFTFDGVDASGILNQAQKQYVRLAIPLDSIAEFQVQSQSFNADSGTTAGGQIAVVSASGTNAFHADAFGYLRNNAVDARPFNALNSPAFLLNQFGGDLSGPVLRNRTFFFLNYEGLRQRLGQTQVGLTPSPSFSAAVAAQSPALAQILQSWPVGTSPTSNPNVWNYIAGANQIDNEDSGGFRLDHRFSQNTTAFLRYNADEADYTVPTGALTAKQETDTKLKNGVAAVTRIFSPTLLTEARMGFNQDQYHVATSSSTPFSVKVSGLSPLNAAATSDAIGSTFSWLNNTTWIRGRHTLKWGGELRAIRLYQGNSQNGTLTYTSLDTFLRNSLDSASYTGLLPLKHGRKTQVYGYVQDQIRLSSSLTVTLGLRYSFFNVFHEADNRAIPFDLATCGGYCPKGSEFTHPRYNDLDPRLAVAWSRGETVLRLGAGLYHTDGQEDDQNLPYANDVQRYSFTVSGSPGLAYPLTPFLSATTGIVTPRDMDRNRKDAYVAAWTASVQRTLFGGLVGTASYAGNKGTNLLTTTYQNVVNPLTGTRPYPQFGTIEFRKNDSNSTFHALQLSARRSFRHGWLLSANYMWSHSINDDGIGGGESDTPQNVSCRACEKASSDFDIRHIINGNVVYRLPLRGWLLGDWDLSGIASFRSALPVNVTVDRSGSQLPDLNAVSGSERPTLVPGVSLTPPGGQSAAHWINPAAFQVPPSGAWGNAGRNLARGPRLWQLDSALQKSWAAGERLRVQFRAEVYNLLNRAQLGQPLANLASPLNFGQIPSPVNQGPTGSGTPRQFQFAIRLAF